MTATSTASRRLPPGTLVASVALVWSLVVFVGFATLPFYSASTVSTSSDGAVVSEEDTSSTIIEHEGAGVIALLVVPALLALGGLAGAALRLPALSIVAAGLAVAFCLVGMMSIGLFYLPAAVLLVVAAVRSARRPR